jgi:hypothetical protein
VIRTKRLVRARHWLPWLGEGRDCGIPQRKAVVDGGDRPGDRARDGGGAGESVALLLDEGFGTAVFRVHKDDVCRDSAGNIDG